MKFLKHLFLILYLCLTSCSKDTSLYLFNNEFYKYGYVDQEGKIVVQPIFDNARHFQEGFDLARVKKNKKWGYINRDGEIVVEPIFDYGYSFKSESEIIYVKFGKRRSFITKKGKLINFTNKDLDKERVKMTERKKLQE